MANFHIPDTGHLVEYFQKLLSLTMNTFGVVVVIKPFHLGF